MRRNVISFRNKQRKWLGPGMQKLVILVLLALVANHLTQEIYFPLSDSYEFPLGTIIATLVLGLLIFCIAELNFRWFKIKFFTQKVDVQNLTYFLLSNLTFITLLYIPAFYLVSWLIDSDIDLRDFLSGLSITLLLSIIGIVMIYAKQLYHLHKLILINDKLLIEKGSKKVMVPYSDIAYFFSEDKVVYMIDKKGNPVATSFTLNELEDKINEHLFFRTNRKTLVGANAIYQIENIENGKLIVSIRPVIFGKESLQIIISRYKKQEFLSWFNRKNK